jgi:hypothetical protein
VPITPLWHKAGARCSSGWRSRGDRAPEQGDGLVNCPSTLGRAWGHGTESPRFVGHRLDCVQRLASSEVWAACIRRSHSRNSQRRAVRVGKHSRERQLRVRRGQQVAARKWGGDFWLIAPSRQRPAMPGCQGGPCTRSRISDRTSAVAYPSACGNLPGATRPGSSFASAIAARNVSARKQDGIGNAANQVPCRPLPAGIPRALGKGW